MIADAESPQPQDAAPLSSRTAEVLRKVVPVLVAFVASRLLIGTIIVLSREIIVRGPFWQPGGLLAALTQWDSFYYVSIARDGYFRSVETEGTVAFFPFYPLLVHVVSFVFHEMRVAAVLTSNLCLLGAGLLLQRLVEREMNDRALGNYAVAFLMFGPVSFFFSTAYTEATFLLLAIACLYAAIEGRWLVAGLCGMCLGATRNVGFWIAVPLFLEHVRQTAPHRTLLNVALNRRILAIALVPLGLIAFMLLGYVKRGDPLAFATAGAAWGRVLVSPIRTLATAPLNPPFYEWLFVTALLVALIVWLAGWLYVRGSYLVWAALLIFTYLSSNSLEAIPRYLSVIFPFYIVLAIVARRYRWSYEPLLACSTALLTICTILLANGYWMT